MNTDKARRHVLKKLLREVGSIRQSLHRSQVRARCQFRLLAAGGIERAVTPGQCEIGEADASAAARAASTQRVVFEQTQSLHQARRQYFVFVAKNVKHHADTET